MSVRVLIVGTGLIGASLGLALRSLGPAFDGTLLGWDADAAELEKAREIGAIDEALPAAEAALQRDAADIYVLATPVLPILDWMERLAMVTGPGQLITDVGSTKQEIVQRAATLYNGPAQAQYLPSHPMAGKESRGAAMAEAGLFREAAWLFTPGVCAATERVRLWLSWIDAIGARRFEVPPREHDRLCAWVSHLPQMLSTALASVLEETFRGDPSGQELLTAIGGRALRETTRLGASPYSMWRDIALTNTEPLAATLYALEQQLAHLRENLKTPELREIFREANDFRSP